MVTLSDLLSFCPLNSNLEPPPFFFLLENRQASIDNNKIIYYNIMKYIRKKQNLTHHFWTKVNEQ